MQTRATAEHKDRNDEPSDGPSHPFYSRLNQMLREHGFNDFPEAP
jgi:hypothetical protein